jgi:transcriptional regulator GlxA family with amidase domain
VAARVPRVIVLCSGSFFLAAAGLLEGRRAATHWSVAALQQQRYPAVDVDADAIVVRDGHLWTSAGVTACIDLALDVARDLVMYPKRPGGQSQFSVQFSSQAVQTDVVKAVQDYVLANLAEPLDLEVLAAQAWMSERHLPLSRPARLEGAKQLLQAPRHLPLKTVAARVGLRSKQALRHLFVRHMGITPVVYRERFGGHSR